MASAKAPASDGDIAPSPARFRCEAALRLRASLLHKEPELLRVDAESIRRQMQEVAVSNYRTFIVAADALAEIRDEISKIPKLTSRCSGFVDDSTEHILEKRKMNQTLLANHTTLIDLLEIPKLMDTCVRNGNYDEALDLEASVAKLTTMHPKIPIIQALSAEVRETTQFLLSHLLQKLKSNISVTRVPTYYWVFTPNRSFQ